MIIFIVLIYLAIVIIVAECLINDLDIDKQTKYAYIYRSYMLASLWPIGFIFVCLRDIVMWIGRVFCTIYLKITNKE